HELVEPVEQTHDPVPVGNVERQCPACSRKADETAAVVLEALEDREKRRALVRAESLEHGTHNGFGAVRHDELILHESARSVDPVPIEHGVERVEECGDALELTPSFAWRLSEPQLVERADR